MKKILILLAGFFCLSFAQAQQPSQDRAKLEKERQDIQREIQEIQSSYNKVNHLKKESLAKLAILQRKLELQDRLIGNINREIHDLNDDIYLSAVEINRRQVKLDTLKAQYARSVVNAYKNKSSYDYLNFIFSATGFNDALRRVSYLKAYRTYRQQQVSTILEEKKNIELKKQQLTVKQSNKKSALENQQVQLSELENQKKEKNAVVLKFKTQEKDLSKQIAVKRKRDNALQSQIRAIIRRDLERARREAEAEERAKNSTAATPSTTTANPNARTSTTKAPAASRSYLDLSSKNIALNASFEKNKGSLPWPVDNGVVTIPFGRSTADGLAIDNPGITIATPSANMPVKAVFDGEVSSISNIGDGLVVTVRHGKYFSVYWTLSSVSVSKGQAVKTGEVIGRNASAEDGAGGQLDFMIMIEMKNVNPTGWLRR